MLEMPSFALHVAHMATQLAKTVTIYTNGNASVGQAIQETPGSVSGWKFDNRKISRLALSSEGNMAVDMFFEDGSQNTEQFLAHSPTMRVRGPFAEQLGLELTKNGDYKVNGPFNETTLGGVFAAGDCAAMFKVFTNAIATGSTTGAGVATRLQEELHGAEPLW